MTRSETSSSELEPRYDDVSLAFHFLLEPVLVNGDARFVGDVFEEIERHAERVVKLERVGAW